MSERIILAYAGGLESSVCVHWLRSKRNLEVVTLSADLGGHTELDEMAEQAVDAGASGAHVTDLREPFVNEFVLRVLQANARYEQGYFLSTALGRPLIARELVRIAREEGTRLIAHGASLYGNDHARFDALIGSLAPEIEVLSPQRDWELTDRAALLDYARRHQIPVPRHSEQGFNIDINLWGSRTRRGLVDDPWIEPPPSAYVMTNDPRDAPDEPAELQIGFIAGTPTQLDGETLGLVEMIDKLNVIGGRHGVGRFDCVENLMRGSKTRDIYEAPAAAILMSCHQALQELTLSKEVMHFKDSLSRKYADLVYNGQWYTQLRGALDGFFGSLQSPVTGQVRMRLFKGGHSVIGRQSEFSLYDSNDRLDALRDGSASGYIKVMNRPSQKEAEQMARVEALQRDA